MMDSFRSQARTAFALRLLPVLLATSSCFGQSTFGPPTPAEALKAIRISDPGLMLELVAAEPDVESPVALAWDENGVLFVAEMRDYPDAASKGAIKRLEDRDDDGRFERVTVFADGLLYPNSVLPWNGGLLVTAAPDLWFLRDTDGDGRADDRRVVLTGFHEGNQQLRANGLSWGLDLWVYGANGRSGGALRLPSAPADQAVSIARNDFRFRPDTGQVEAISGFSQFGLPRNDVGDRFPSWNTIPIRHVVLEERHLARNPYLATAETVAPILDPADGGRVYPIGPAPVTFNGESFGYFNASCGPTVYRGDLLPGAYRGNAFVCEPLTSLVHRRVLEPVGPTFLAKRVEQGREFLASSHPWFRPVNLATGPDGALYIADFCRALVEHPAFVPERLRSGVAFREGHEHGRLWRVRPTGPRRAVPRPQLGKATTAELVALLDHPNGWWRDTAQRLLGERRAAGTASLLSDLLRTASPLGRVHALWTLQALQALSNDQIKAALHDPDPRVREHALRLSEGRSEGLIAAILPLADDPEARVRFRCALVLGESDAPAALKALARIASKDTADPWTRLAILSGLSRTAGSFLTILATTEPRWLTDPTADRLALLREVAAIIGARRDPTELEPLLRRLGPTSGTIGRLALLAGLGDGLTRSGPPLSAFRREPPESLRVAVRALDGLLDEARALATDTNAAVEARALAVEVLSTTVGPDASDLVVGLLGPGAPQAVQSAAARGTVAIGDPRIVDRAVEQWSTLTTTTRRELLAAFVRSKPLAAALITAIEQDRLALSELGPAAREALRSQPDPQTRRRAERLLQAAGRSDREEVLRRNEDALTLAGDPERGRAVFEKNCQSCHEWQGRGHRVGPDLRSVVGRPKARLLTDILDPNREVAPDATSYLLVTHEGQVLDGLLVSETPTSVRLRRAEGAEDTVLRSQIAELRATGRSLMPEGLEQSLSARDLADLIELLRRP